uniref:uncharacterized protein C1orf100-like n=1 Tax=Solea senegalensis TaxID=28829 RepID=UPI001CD8AD7C|nr:uncharacterized protein C1orf100-like [Solea senegalensis]
MAGSGVAVRLHEFKESRDLEEPNRSTARTSRPGRDAHGLYPGQLGRVHTIPLKDCGFIRRSGRCHESLNQHQENDRPSLDIQTLREEVLRHSAALAHQRPLQTTYQEDFCRQSLLFPQ